MKNDLTADQLREVLDYSPDTGVFRWKKRISIRIEVGQEAGSRGEGRIEIGVYGHNYLAHRLAWLWMTGEWPSKQVDHKDVDGLNNRWANLRLATHSENVRNSGRRRNNTSGYKGVSFAPKERKWHARIMANRELHLLGYFDRKEDAAAAYAEAAKRLHGEFSRTD